MQRALESAVAELVLGPPLALEDASAVESFFARHGIGDDDARALREGELERLLVYRGLVRGTLREALEASIPRSMARLGPIFDAYFDRFLSERGPASHYLRDLTSELLDFCAPLWAIDPAVPAYAIELARHEALHIEIAATPPRPHPGSDAPLEVDAGLEFIEASRLVRYAHAVHRLPDDLDDRSAPEAAPAYLFVYRSPEHDVRYLELTPLAYAIVERLRAGASLKDALSGAAAAENHALDSAVVTGTARLLSDLAERGAVAGIRPKHACSAVSDYSEPRG